MKRIVKKIKSKEKKILRSIRKSTPENNGDVISFRSPVAYENIKVKKLQNVKSKKRRNNNIDAASLDLPSHSPRINEINVRVHSAKESLVSEENEIIEEDANSNDSDDNEKAYEVFLPANPFLVEVNSDHTLSSGPLKIGGSCFKSLPSNLAFGFKSKSTVSFSVKPLNPEKCEIYFGNCEEMQHASDPNKCDELACNEDISLIENDEDISYLQTSKSNENVSLNVKDLPLSEPFMLEKLPGNKMLLTMTHPHAEFLHGSFSIKVLVGTVEILGFEIGYGDNRSYDVYSPSGSSLLCLETKNMKKDALWDNLHSKLSELEVSPQFLERLHKKFPRLDTVVLLQKITNSLPQFLNKNHSSTLFPTPAVNVPSDHPLMCVHCEFISKQELSHYRGFTRSEEWDEVLQFLVSKSEEECALRVMLCGGKALGKSTLLRFLVNKLLTVHQQVLYLDFDPGQSEFTVPGCVSAVLVEKPLLGPHYTHLTQPCRSIYVGHVNVAQCSFHYLKCCEEILKFCQSKSEFSNIPWVFNTMGFVKGVGVEITVSLIKMANPTDIIQIQSVSRKRNYPEILTPEYIANFQRSLFTRIDNEEISLKYALHCFNSEAETQGLLGHTNPWGLEAYKLRDLIILAYFSQIVSKPVYSLQEAVPFSIPFAGLKLCISHERVHFNHYLTAMNGNLVALCNVGNIDTWKPNDPEYPEILENTPLCPCIGFGIVRGIDMIKRLVFISSPVSEAERKSIDCLVLGSVRLPPSLYANTGQALGHIPYVVTGQQPILSERPRQTSSLAKTFQGKRAS